MIEDAKQDNIPRLQNVRRTPVVANCRQRNKQPWELTGWAVVTLDDFDIRDGVDYEPTTATTVKNTFRQKHAIIVAKKWLKKCGGRSVGTSTLYDLGRNVHLRIWSNNNTHLITGCRECLNLLSGSRHSWPQLPVRRTPPGADIMYTQVSTIAILGTTSCTGIT